MNKQATLKGRLTSIKNYLIELGAEFVKNSEKSNSIYLKMRNDSIRLSDHLSPVASHSGINIVVPMNSLATIVSINGAVMVYDTFAELKSFLKSWANVVECLVYSKESTMNTNILKKQYELNCLHSDIMTEKNKLANIQRNVEAQKRQLEKLEKINNFSLQDLTDKQVNQVMQLVDNYRMHSKKKQS